MASTVRSGFGSDAASTVVAVAEFLVRGVQAPQGGKLSILSITPFVHTNGVAQFSGIAGAILKIVKLPPTSPQNVTIAWSDAFAGTNPGAAEVVFSSRVRAGYFAHFRFDVGEIECENGEILYVALGASIDDAGAGVITTSDLTVNGRFGSGGDTPYELR